MSHSNIYFLSDFHLGVPTPEESRKREKKIVEFLSAIENKASEIFILGDIFDFWFEYKQVVPKGYVRLLGKLAALSDKGIPIHCFIGNHDMWMKDYFTEEMNIKIYKAPTNFIRNGKNFLIGHGDGLGPGDKGYKFLKKIFRNPICQFLFGWIHPDLGIRIANYFSRKSREKAYPEAKSFLGENNEWLIQYCREVLKTESYNYLIFGHRHLPIEYPLSKESTYVNLGDWIHYFSYAAFDGETLRLKYWQ